MVRLPEPGAHADLIRSDRGERDACNLDLAVAKRRQELAAHVGRMYTSPGLAHLLVEDCCVKPIWNGPACLDEFANQLPAGFTRDPLGVVCCCHYRASS
jgi:hypothetical protein